MSVGGGSLESKEVCLYNFSFQINPRFSWLIPHNMLLDVNFPSGKYQPFQVRKKIFVLKMTSHCGCIGNKILTWADTHIILLVIYNGISSSYPWYPSKVNSSIHTCLLVQSFNPKFGCLNAVSAGYNLLNPFCHKFDETYGVDHGWMDR